MSDERAVSSVVGMVLILGITVAAMTSVVVIGGVALQSSQDDAQLSQMETSMAEMSSKASLSALGESNSQRFDLGDTRNGDVEVRPNAGNVSIAYEINTSEGNVSGWVYEGSDLGALVYAQGDREVAYQGGGVWKRNGNDGGEMISPPEYHYQAETLTFPIVRVAGDGISNEAGEGSVVRQSSSTVFPNSTADGNFTNPIEDMTVFVKIESNYHRGWYEFFSSRSDGELDYDPENQTVIMELTVPFDGTFDNAVAATGDIQGTDHIEGEYDEGQYRQSASSLIEEKIANYSDVEDGLDSGDTYDKKVYFVDGDATIDSAVTFDTEDHDIDVVVNGTLTINENVVIDGDNSVNFYLREGFDIGGGNPIINDGHADQLKVFVHSDVEEIDSAANFNGEMAALIYATGSHIDWKGNSEFTGAIITRSANFGGNIEVRYDAAFEDFELDLPTEADVLRYLHITDNLIAFELD